MASAVTSPNGCRLSNSMAAFKMADSAAALRCRPRRLGGDSVILGIIASVSALEICIQGRRPPCLHLPLEPVKFRGETFVGETAKQQMQRRLGRGYRFHNHVRGPSRIAWLLSVTLGSGGACLAGCFPIIRQDL